MPRWEGSSKWRGLRNILYLCLLKVLPKHMLSRVAGWFADRRMSRYMIRAFAMRYGINLDEAEKPVGTYRTLNEFFTRGLKEGARPIQDRERCDVVISPVDGTISEFGRIAGDRMIQAKGRTYTLANLLGSGEEAERFLDGSYMTIYLAPCNYHRIHHYTDGRITGFRYVPGSLFPVNRFSVEHIQGLFADNERLTTYIDTVFGPSALVKIGATIVGKITVAYDRIVTHAHARGAAKTYRQALPVRKGAALGCFEMGSTVILLFPRDAFVFDALQKHASVRMGERIGVWQSPPQGHAPCNFIRA